MKLNTKRQQLFYIANPLLSIFCFIVLMGVVCSCNERKNTPVPKHEVVKTPEQMNVKVPEIISQSIAQITDNNGRMDSIIILQPALLKYLYEKNEDEARWSKEAKWTSTGDSLIKFIENARLYGLFPEDYHFNTISQINEKFTKDTISKKDAVLWSKADILLTDALLQMIKDVKLGRLQKDSITLRTDSALSNEFYEEQLEKIVQSNDISGTIDSLEPKMMAYHELKQGIKNFLDSAHFKDYTYIPNPIYDSIGFKQALQKRLFEEGLIDSLTTDINNAVIAKALKKYQEEKKLTVDGKAGGETIRALNLTDKEKFIRIALSLDKYKMLPAKMPEKYVWVNLAGYNMQLYEDDSVRIYSKIVVGKPLTRTPELTSAISEMITYPQWSVPQSIIIKEFLPALKKDPNYLAKKGFSLLNSKNEEVDPYFVDWSKYKTGIPYKIVQGSGDDNALGVMKFNFPNKYAVYLHDTNQRYYFSRSSRALSHGCVRVQEWQKLANYILKNDSTNSKTQSSGSYTKADSVETWLYKKEKHFIPVRNKIPVFIRYYTCEGRDGKIVFFDDIYNEDHLLEEKYFAKK